MNKVPSQLEASSEKGVATVSVVILTCNEQANIGACLDSVLGWTREVFVVDSGSTDRTVEICRQKGVQVLSHPFETYGLQRNWAIVNLPMRGDWELHLDADERVTPELRKEIFEKLPTLPAEIEGVLVSRFTVFMGRPILHGGRYPTYHLRLFRRGKGRCEERLYDQHFLVAGRTARFRGDIVDTLTSSLDVWVQRHIRWAALEAEQLEHGSHAGLVREKLTGNPIERRRWFRTNLYERFPLFWRAGMFFVFRYIFQLGFLDGRRGLIFHFLHGFWYRFLVDAKIYEMRRCRK